MTPAVFATSCIDTSLNPRAPNSCRPAATILSRPPPRPVRIAGTLTCGLATLTLWPGDLDAGGTGA